MKWHRGPVAIAKKGARFLYVLSLLVEARRYSVPEVRANTTVGADARFGCSQVGALFPEFWGQLVPSVSAFSSRALMGRKHSTAIYHRDGSPDLFL